MITRIVIINSIISSSLSSSSSWRCQTHCEREPTTTQPRRELSGRLEPSVGANTRVLSGMYLFTVFVRLLSVPGTLSVSVPDDSEVTFSGTTGWWPTSRGWTFGWSPSLWPATVLPSCCNSPTWRRSTRFGGKSVWGCLPALLQPWTTFTTGTEHGIKISKLIVVLETFNYW